MNRKSLAALGVAFLMTCGSLAWGAATDNPAMNAPDMVSWQLFLHVNTSAGGGNALYETWASDADTFVLHPKFPTGPAVLALHPLAVPTQGALAALHAGRGQAAIPPIPSDFGEESRRNQDAFNFIVSNHLNTVKGLRAAFGTTVTFPVGAIEVKGDWRLAANIPAWTLNRVKLADVPKYFHTNVGADKKLYALVAMHIISKEIPNWTWATFENAYNPGRCDILGCEDKYGAKTAHVAPNPIQGKGYAPCTQTAALAALFAAAKIDPAFKNYCLKGSQTDFTSNTGLDIRLGNSVIEDGFVDHSSCMSCHGRAAWDAKGVAVPNAGFLPDGNAPLGPLLPQWYWTFSGQPPIWEGMPGLKQNYTSADFVWSIPFCAYDDTVTPGKQRCASK